MSFSGRQAEKNAKTNVVKPDDIEVLHRAATGDSYLKWFLALRRSLPSHSSRYVQEYGMKVIEDTSAWDEDFGRRMQVAVEDRNDFERKRLYDLKAARDSAARTIFHLVLSKLSDEVKDLIEMSDEYKVLEKEEIESPSALLRLVKKTVSKGVTANISYQSFLALQHLLDTKQKKDEDLRVYLERVKAAAAVFEGIDRPLGHVLCYPDVKLKREFLEQARASSSSSSRSQRDLRVLEGLDMTIPSEMLEPVMPSSGWVDPEFAVMTAIHGLNGHYDHMKTAWVNKLVDPTCGGLEIPTNLDDLGSKINSWEAISKSLSGKQPTEVKATNVNKGKFGKQGKKQGKASGNKAGAKHKNKSFGERVLEKTTCWHCNKVGHRRDDCKAWKKMKAQEADKSGSDDESEAEPKAPKASKKKGKSSGKTGAEVKATCVTDDNDVVDAHDQFVLHMTKVGRVSSDRGDSASDASRSMSLLLDNCANESIIANVDLLVDVEERSFEQTVTTAYGVETRQYDGMGTLVIAGVPHRVYIDQRANDNIVSYGRFEAALLRKGYGIYAPRRRSSQERPIAAVVVDTDDKELLTVYFQDRMARFSLRDVIRVNLTEFGKTLSSADLERAKVARELQERLGYASMTAVHTMLARGSIVTSIKGKDLLAARDALGPSEVEVKAKQPRKKVSIRRVLADQDFPVEEQVLYADVMETMGKEFVLGVLEPMHLIMADALPSGKGFTHKEVVNSLKKMSGMVFEQGYKICETHFDSAAKSGDLAKYPGLVVHPPGQHVAQAERAIRTIKEVLRGLVQARPWLPWWGRFAVEAVGAATMYLSLRHAKNSRSLLSPLQQLTGRTPVADRDFKASFGDLVLVENLRDEATKSDVTRPRVVEAVWLRPTFDDHGSALVLLLDSCVIASRVLASRIEWEGHQPQLVKLYEWAGAPRTDLERSEVRFTEKGKVYNLLSCMPDPGADVLWETGYNPGFHKTLVGKTSGGFPLPSRVESGVDVPVLSGALCEPTSAGASRAGIGVAHSGVVGEAATGTAVAVEHASGLTSGDAVAGATDTGTAAVFDMPAVDSHAVAGRVGTWVPTMAAGAAADDSSSGSGGELHMSTETDLPEPDTVGVKRKLTPSASLGVVPGVAAEQVVLLPGGQATLEETYRDQPEELVVNVSERGRVRRKSFKLLSTEVGKVTEMVTTRIAKGMHEVNALQGKLRDRANAALLEEIRNLIQDHSTLSGAYKSDVGSGDEILPVSVIVEDKAVNGKSVKDKARIIAGGHRQDKNDFRSLSTQTVNTESVFILLAITACENRELMVIDVKGAYLNADMKRPDGKQTFIKIDKQLAKLFVEVEPSLKKFAASDGTMILRLDKALYGCIQSSALWQNKLTETLIAMGYRISSYDACVAISPSGNVIVCFHVDDLLVVSKDAVASRKFKAKFEKFFTITSKEGSELDYLGIHIRRTGRGIELSQKAMVAKLIADTKGTANSPAAMIEEEPNAAEEELLPDHEAAEYRSATALALYLSKRTRPDILQAVNMLCRKAQTPSVKDKVALRRLIRYMSKTRNSVMILPATSLNVEAYIDASFATAKDRKSITGATIMIGGAVIWCKSGKQSIVTKSSFEAELVALSDMASMVLWVCLFMRDLGFAIETPIIYQDNQSTIKVAETGPSTNPLTKHIDIRYMWLKEIIKLGKLRLEYASTDDMVADGFTKPLVGEKFYKFVESLNLIDGNSRG